jgi:hypothetical protein
MDKLLVETVEVRGRSSFWRVIDMRVEHVVLFKVDELTEEAQYKAHEAWVNECHEIVWAEENRESLKAFCREFPVEAKNWWYDVGNGGITPVMGYGFIEDEVWELTGLRLRTWLINNYGHVLTEGRYFSIVISTNPYRYKAKRSKAILEESCCPFTGYCMDESLLAPIREFIRKPDGRTLEDLLTKCLWSWVDACREDAEYQVSFEYFVEHARANEYEFTADGRMQ